MCHPICLQAGRMNSIAAPALPYSLVPPDCCSGGDELAPMSLMLVFLFGFFKRFWHHRR